VLAEEEHPAFMQGTFQFVPVFGRSLPALQEAFRTGGGVPWSDYDPELAQALERFLGPTYRDKLVAEWIPAIDGMVDRLAAGATVADVGCGSGLTTVLMAEAFPRSRFRGLDTDRTALARARELAAAAGVAGWCEFLPVSGSDLPGRDYDLVTTFNCLHDMGDPAGVARLLRGALAPDGAWLLVEPRAGDTVEENLTPFGRMTYGGSTMLCVPSALAQPGGTALGAQAGEGRLRALLSAAGFGSVVRRADSGVSMVFEVRP
jgi:SAM-dependent methyltransferase